MKFHAGDVTYVNVMGKQDGTDVDDVKPHEYDVVSRELIKRLLANGVDFGLGWVHDSLVE